MITTDTVLTVPTDYATVQAALASLNDQWIAANAKVTIKVTADAEYTQSILVSHGNGDKIEILGNTVVGEQPVVLTFTGCYGVQVANGKSLLLLDGFVLKGDGSSGNHGILVNDRSLLKIGEKLTVQGFGGNGVWALRGSVIYAKALTVTGNGGHGLVSSQGSSVEVATLKVSQNGSIGVYAWLNSTILATSSESNSNVHDGYRADSGSTIWASSSKSNSNGQNGVWALRTSSIFFYSNTVGGSQLIGNGAFGAQASEMGYTHAMNASNSGNVAGPINPATSGTPGNYNAVVLGP
jgi:hypothetical protein